MTKETLENGTVPVVYSKIRIRQLSPINQIVAIIIRTRTQQTNSHSISTQKRIMNEIMYENEEKYDNGNNL